VKALERAGYLAVARLPRFQALLGQARRVVQRALEITRNPYVAYSGGKDSACLLWLVLEQKPDVAARILTSGESRLLHPNLDAVLDWWRLRFPNLDLQEINVDRVWSAEWREATWTEQRKAGKGDIIRELPASGAFDGVFLGLRDEESNARRLANKRGLIRRYAETRSDATAGMWCFCPLASWTIEDVGAMIVLHDLPLLAAYQVEGLQARTTQRLTGDAVRQNAFVNLRMRDRVAYNRLLERFPELGEWDG